MEKDELGLQVTALKEGRLIWQRNFQPIFYLILFKLIKT